MTSRTKTWWTGGLRLAVLALVVAFSAACDDLLEVDLPGSVVAEDLNNPELAETLVLSVQGDFECGFVDYMVFPGQWFEEFQNTSQSRPDALVGLRSNLVAVYADPCDSGTGPIWTVLQVPRQQGRHAVELISGFDPTLVPNADFLIAKARMYEGYSIQLLGEQFCGVTIDSGPLLSRDEAFGEAIARFDEAITKANASISAGIETADATAVLNAAYVGRARAKLYRGDLTGADADASQVTAGFEYVATYDANPGRRRNRIHERMNRGDQEMPHRDYWDLRIDPATGLTTDGAGEPLQGVGDPDPRVVVQVEAEDEPRGVYKYRTQQKYIGDDASIPFSTWREAQLMIAEARQGQDAVDIINNLRQDPTGLPAGIDSSQWPLPLVTSSAAALGPAGVELLVREERRRELWMQGVQAGDKYRWGYPGWDTEDMYAQQLGPGNCMQVPFLEQTANPNL